MNRIAERRTFLGVALVGGALDLLTKTLVFGYLGADASAESGLSYVPSKPIIPNFFSLEAAVNPGSLWGLFRDHPDALFWVTVAIFAMLILLAGSEKSKPLPVQIALGLFCAGAIGNLADRIRYHKVRDFLLFYVGDWKWPNFNLADTCICVGAVVFLWAEWQRSKELARKAPAPVLEKTGPGPVGGAEG